MYDLYAQFPKQQVVKDRQYSALLRWAGYVTALPIPGAKPDEAWVEQRVIAWKVPGQPTVYVEATLAWVLKDPGIQTNIRQHLSAYNDEAVEAAMDAQLDGAMAVAMPMYCHSVVTQAEIDQWYADNDFVEPSLAARTPVSGRRMREPRIEEKV